MSWGQTTSPSVSSIGAQPLDSDLTAIAALSTTSYGRSLLALADAAANLTGLGISAYIQTLLDDTDGITARTTLGISPMSAPGSQRIYASTLSSDGGVNPTTSGTAIFVYVGQTSSPIVCKYVEFYVGTAGSGAQTAEVGLFSTPSAPNKANQTLTKLVADGTVDNLTAGNATKRNTTAFNGGAGYTVPGGTHLWAGIRTAMATTQPACTRLLIGMKQGQVLQTAASGALTASSTFAGVTQSDGSQPPDLRVTLD